MKHFGSIFILFAVSISILMLLLMPHHHHGSIPCFTEDITQSCCKHNHNQSSEANHSDCCNHNHSGKGSCIIEQIVMVDIQKGGNGQQCQTCLHAHANHLLQAILFALNNDFSTSEKGVCFLPPPYLITYQSEFAGQNLGLRAPPFC